MTPRYKERRGRPKGRSGQDYDNLESMVLIACKHDLEPKQLIDAFFEALQNDVSHIGSLKITCRNVNQDSATFLITKEEKVVWQFPVKLEIITNPRLRDSIKEITIPKSLKVDEKGRNRKIGELSFGMKGVNVIAKIVEVPPARNVMTRFGTFATVSNVMVADETGSVRLGLWNDKIERFHKGDEVELSTCKVSRFRGALQLSLGRKGTISTINQPQQEELINFSSLR